MKTKLSLLFTLLLFLNCKDDTKVLQNETLNPIEYLMVNNANLMLEYPEINSISIGVYKDGKTYNGYYGEIDKGRNNLPNDSSLFEIASVTKSFTGIITAQAVLDGKIKLEDDIRIYFDGSFPNLEFENRPIQIRDLLTHTSGIRRDFSEVLAKMFSPNATWKDKKEIQNYNRDTLLKDLMTYKLDTIPGVKYEYSPFIGPELLVLILEKVYDKSYIELIDEQILYKANMSETTMSLTSLEGERFIRSYTDEGQIVEPMTVIMSGAGGGLKSTIPNMTNYIKYLLETDNPVIKEMQKPLFKDEEDDMFGYFWQVNTDGEFMHNGGTNGSTNWVIVMPELNAGFTVAFNSNGDTSGTLINRIANNIINDLERFPKKNVYFLLQNKIFENTDKGIAFYKTSKAEKANEFDFKDSSALNTIGYDLLGYKQNEAAIKVFQLLVSEFPNEGNPYDSLGEAYFINEQYDLSLENYKKAFELNSNNGNAKTMIDEINTIISQS
ncbi:serine hydrolase [Psychroserpens ponticola]|uniref:Serine hydrolase n=1 Tax=Psychroserpens ponticola TaxID=2932268 RepID=A0ABY7S664_9FLAO|nr:serine hydrolase [Psychroserpens ponticola]WCO03360.1 serine hydrolase [Psychroserpens ponticola]